MVVCVTKPLAIIINTARNHFRRAKQLSNTHESKLRSYERISQLLAANNYPKHVIESLRHEVDTAQSIKAKKLNKEVQRFLLTLPFVNDNVLSECKTAVKLSGLENIQLSSKPPPNLKNRLVQTPLEPRKCPKNCKGCETSDGESSCTSRLVVYKLVCLLCLEFYLGETYRAFYERIKEHLSSVRKDSDDLTISTHFKEHHPDTPIQDRKFKSAILQKCPDYCSLMITESELISKLDPKINVYSGKWALLN